MTSRQVLAIARLAYVHMLEPACKKRLQAKASKLRDLELDARKGEVGGNKGNHAVGQVGDLVVQELVELTLITPIALITLIGRAEKYVPNDGGATMDYGGAIQ